VAKVLVTGGAGFIGSHVVDALIDNGCEVVVVDNLSTGKRETVHSNVHFHCLDICSPEISDLFAVEKIEWVIHHAAQIDVRKSVDDPRYDARVNIDGLLNLLENCRRHATRGVIFASSGGAIYGEPATLPVDEKTPKSPLSPYAVSKLTAENYLYYYNRVHRLPYVALRYGNVYGPRQSIGGESGVIAIFTGKMLAGETANIFGDGEQVRDYVYVGDIARANLLALDKLASLSIAGSIDDRAFNLGTGKGTTVNELYRQLQGITGYRGKPYYTAERKGELRQTFLDIRKAQKVLAWQPSVTLAAGLAKTVEYWERKTRAN
jgi:UDP-glucose 4-epimerase